MGKLVGIEVKAAASIGGADFAGLRQLAAMAADRFAAGIVLYDGDATLPFGPKFWAVPIGTLWRARFR